MKVCRGENRIKSSGICSEELETGSGYVVVSGGARGALAFWDLSVSNKYITKIETSTATDLYRSRLYRRDFTTIAVHPIGRWFRAKCETHED